MPFYLTRDPVPSADMRNVFDNAQNLDLALNDLTSSLWTDRLGRSRMSWFGLESAFSVKLSDFESRFTSQIVEQEATFDASQADKENRFQHFLVSSGYVFLGDYEDGPFQFSARNQYIRYDNQYYRLNAATDVGFTTTGTDATSFANDVTHFVLMDGDTLRQNLGSGEEGLGSDLSAFVERIAVATPYLKTVSDILNLEPVNVLRGIPKSFHAAILSGTSEVDVSQYVNELAQAVSGAGTEKRGQLIFPHGRIAVAAPLILCRQLNIVGAGAHATELFLLPGSDCDVITSENFAALTETGFTTDNALVPSWMGLHKLRINGNRSNNAAGNGVSLYGPRINFDELLVMYCAGNGIYSEYSDLFGSDDWVGQEEGRIGTVISRNNGKRGWHYRGPHNTVANNIICAYNDDWGFYSETLAGKYDGNITSLENLHTYANANGAGDKGSYFGSVTSIGYLIIDGDYCEIAAIGCQISKVKGIFLGQSNNGINIIGNRTNIGEMHMSMHSTAVGRSLVNITGSDNKIGAFYGTSEAAKGL
ncbi:TPA: hypothetical protein QHP45_004939, partial [Klebsiella quasipneumoniae subsp. similipneumoniae]|nr:hypothetical protein [Klebsiella quasipneumoniae subsp. similipneumoniae]